MDFHLKSELTSLREKDLKNLSMGCFALAIASLVLQIFTFRLFGNIASALACLVVLLFIFPLAKSQSSAYLNMTILGILLQFLAELAIVYDYNLTKYTFWYTAFVGMHVLRNLSLTASYMWNVLKSEIYNDLWIKALPYVGGIVIFFILRIYVYSGLDEAILHLIFCISNALLLWSSSLRTNHTSDKSLYYGVASVLMLIFSDVCLILWTGGFGGGLRGFFVVIGGYGIVLATFDHVENYKSSVKTRIYHQNDSGYKAMGDKKLEAVI
jgi:hypothetical protein